MNLYYSTDLEPNKTLYTFSELKQIVENKYKVFLISESSSFRTIEKVFQAHSINIVPLTVVEERPSLVHVMVDKIIDLDKRTVTLVWEKSPELVQERLMKLRQMRNDMLKETDFINFVEVVNKSEIEAYRTILRELPELAKVHDDPMSILDNLICCPKIQTNIPKSETLSEDEYNDYLNRGNIEFINAWKKLNFTKCQKVVRALYEITNQL